MSWRCLTWHVRCKQGYASSIAGAMSKKALHCTSNHNRWVRLFVREALAHKLQTCKVLAADSRHVLRSLQLLITAAAVLACTQSWCSRERTAGAYSILLPCRSGVTSSWHRCGGLSGPSCFLTAFMHSTTADDSTGLAEYALPKRKLPEIWLLATAAEAA